MGNHPATERTTKLGHLWPHHKSMARMMVASGATPGDLAKAFGFSNSQISMIINSPLFIIYMSNIEKDANENAAEVGEDIKALATRAVEILAEDMSSDEETRASRGLRNRTAKTILEMNGYLGSKASGGINLTLNQQTNLHVTTKSPEDMDDKELRNNVFDLLGDNEVVEI